MSVKTNLPGLAFAAALVLLLQPVIAIAAGSHATRELTKLEKAAVETGVRKKLKDPESARFKWPPAVIGQETYCGFVNAKNSYGGYAGFVPFYIAIFDDRGKPYAALSMLATDDPEDTNTAVVAQMCATAGFDLLALSLQ